MLRAAGPPVPCLPNQPGYHKGLYLRVAQRLLAMAACIWHNWATGAGDKRSLIA